MFMRDSVPPARADVRILFDKYLHAHEFRTDYVGPQTPGAAMASNDPLNGRIFAAPASAMRAIAIARFALHCLRTAWAEADRYDLVIVRDLPILAAVIFAIARLRARPTAYWMSVPMPLGDRRLAADHLRAGRPLRAVVAWLRGVFAEVIQRGVSLPLARRVFVQSDAMKIAQERAGVPTAKLSAVPMGVDTELVEGIGASDELLAIAPGPWIAYLGALNLARRLEVLIDAMPLLLDEFPGARLAMVGRADTPADAVWLSDYVKRQGLDDQVIFFGARPMREAWRLIGSASVGVSPIPPGPLFDVSSPTKIVEYLALGIPAVGNTIPDQKLVLEESGGGIACEFSPGGFAQAIAKLLRDPEAARRRGAQGRTYVLRERAYATFAARLAPELSALGGAR